MKHMIVGFLLTICLSAFANETIEINAQHGQKDGWMAGGWGSYRVVVTNKGGDTVTLRDFRMNWDDHFDPTRSSRRKLKEVIDPGKSWTKSSVGHMPKQYAERDPEDVPKMKGIVTIEISGEEEKIPFTLPIPVAVLPEPTRIMKGQNVGLELMESRYDEFEHLDRTFRWIDQTYEAMIDLTGGKPYDGQMVILKESPEHPYWAYAGQEIILNTKFVGSTLKDFDNGLMSFGWVHEIGHDFDDKIGPWYIWSGPAAEFQANFKLCYAAEMIEDQSFRYAWNFQPPFFPATDRSIRLKGYELTERMFLMFGDQYLADPNRSWESLKSDEMHSLFQRIQRVYGWDVYKNWYRTYRRLAAEGYKPPKSKAEKINLIVAILSKEAGIDLLPVFKMWRMPVSKEQVEKVKAKYKL